MSDPRRGWTTSSLLLLAGLGLASCNQPSMITGDPFDYPGTWRATGVNERNLQAMVANPADLTQGRGAGTDRGAAGSRPVTRLEEGRRARLPATNISDVGGNVVLEQPGGAGGGGANAR